MVRLITHNMLACHAKGCNSNNFPLKLRDVQVATRDADFSEPFLRGFIPRLEWTALVDAARQLGDESLPTEPLDPSSATEDQLKTLHHVLLEVCWYAYTMADSNHLPKIHIEEGSLICPNCAHVYPVSSGIPNMVRYDKFLIKAAFV
jgi:multifunctional methyltransferase subunit TRM112